MSCLKLRGSKQLKGRYFRYLDGNEWQAMADEVFTEDAQGRYSDGDLSFDGRDAIIGFLSKFMDGPNLLTMHTGHHPEISLTSDTTATGIWYLHSALTARFHRSFSLHSHHYAPRTIGESTCDIGFSLS